MFRILEVRESAQRRSLRELDNIAADGAMGFDTIEIVNNLEQANIDSVWAEEARERLKNGKLYLRVKYPVHCAVESSHCKDHCVNYALSDAKESCFQKQCEHKHDMKCEECEDLKTVLGEIESMIISHCSSDHAQELRADLIYDLRQASRTCFRGRQTSTVASVGSG